MKNYQNTYIILFLMFISFILLTVIIKWTNYLVINDYITESFDNSGHTVNLPLTTTYSCKNFCAPTARCAISGQQCFTDIDCPGCQPYSPPLKKNTGENISGENDAGKLSFGITPQYSSLTAGYGTKETIITDNVHSRPPIANFGVDVWSASSNEVLKLFNKRYKPPHIKYMPIYSERYSVTGEFKEEGPYASNAYLS